MATPCTVATTTATTSRGNCRWATYTEQNRNSRHCKLTEAAVRDIVRALARTPPSAGFAERYGGLANRYGVTPTAIYMVDKGRAWPDVVAAARAA
jgi:hypothetical protein